MSGELQEIIRSVKSYIEFEKESGMDECFSKEAVGASAQELEILKKRGCQVQGLRPGEDEAKCRIRLRQSESKPHVCR